jgi:hypothetical protein
MTHASLLMSLQISAYNLPAGIGLHSRWSQAAARNSGVLKYVKESDSDNKLCA